MSTRPSTALWLLVVVALLPSACSGSPQSPGTTKAHSAATQESAVSKTVPWVLQEFRAASSRTWWALLQNQHAPMSKVVRTADQGSTWTDASPPAAVTGSVFALGQKVAWAQAASIGPRSHQALYRTSDGGAHWLRLASLPAKCQLDFADRMHGWCFITTPSLGSESVAIWRTTDGGITWTLAYTDKHVDRSDGLSGIPVACDKQLGFTSRRVGWVAGTCPTGVPYLIRSADGGRHWKHVNGIGLPPKAAPPINGASLSVPVVSGHSLAVSLTLEGDIHDRHSYVARSQTDGRTWVLKEIPGPGQYWNTFLLTPKVWRTTNGYVVKATNDAGRSWTEWNLQHRLTTQDPRTLDFQYLSGSVGFATPMSGSGTLWRTSDAGKTWTPFSIS
jgi:photosystem II stability/assembly factor-like uncharacterized protein